MFIALSVTAYFVVSALGGFSQATDAVNLYGDQFLNPFASGQNNHFGTIQIISALGWGLGYMGMPHILVRFMGIRSEHEIKYSRRIAMVWLLIAFTASLMVGAFGKAFLTETLTGAATEKIFIMEIMKIFPGFLGGIFLCGIFAAAMSTSDSQLLVGSSAFSQDIYKAFLKKDATQKGQLFVSRLTVIILALIAFFMALDPESSVFGLVSYAWAGFGSTFAPVIILSLFWRKTTRNGALSGMITGGIVYIIWHSISGGIFDLYEIIPGFLSCFIVIIIVSLADKNKNSEMLAEFDSYKKTLN